jgi:hypothetical protein
MNSPESESVEKAAGLGWPDLIDKYLQRLSIRSVVLIFSLVCLIVVGAVFGYSQFGCHATFLPKPDIACKSSEEWKGFFATISDDDGTPDSGSEDLDLSIFENGKVIGISKAIENGVQKEWEYSGAQYTDYLSLSYRSTSNKTGIGTVLLQKWGNIYVGHTEEYVCNGHRFIRCPYVLAKKSSNLDAKTINSTYGGYLNKGCQEVKVAELQLVSVVPQKCGPTHASSAP